MSTWQALNYRDNVAVSLLRPLLDFSLILTAIAAAASWYDNTWNLLYRDNGVLCALMFVFIANFCQLYDKSLRPPRKNDSLLIIVVFTLCYLAVLFLGFLLKNTAEMSRVILLIWYAAGLAGLLLNYQIWHYVIRYLHRQGWKINNGAVIGCNHVSARLAGSLNANNSAGVRITGVYDDKPPVGGSLWNIPFRGGIESLIADISSGAVQVVFIALPISQEQRVREAIDQLCNTTVSFYYVPDPLVVELTRGRMTEFGRMSLIEMSENPLRGVNASVKRLEDLAITICLLPLLLPLTLLIALAVKLTSRGSVFFSQQRYGLDGRVIRVLKFRTMYVCEDGAEVKQATRADSRVTPLGRILRRTSLDEIPQFFNVLAGSMSVIGPRPHAVAHNELYRTLVRGYMMRHKVKPGITGWAQVNGLRGETRTPEVMAKRVEYDKYYIDNWSLLFDLEILLKTVLVVLNIKNVY